MKLKKNIYRIHLHFVYVILRLLKINKINLLSSYIKNFNINFNKNYKVNFKKYNNILTILIVMEAIIDKTKYKHSMIFISDKKDNYYEITELLNSIVMVNKNKDNDEIKELNNFKSIRYKLKI
jgi:hypothetical protein